MPVATPSAEIVTVPCLTDNYAFLLHDRGTGATAAVDVPDPVPIMAEISARGWTLSDILITHHHSDHVGGVDALRAATGARVWGAGADAHRLPALDRRLAAGDDIAIGGLTGNTIDVSGHSIGHVAFHFPAAEALFTGDSLMALGCGRLFEGTPATMWASLRRLRALPGDPWVCSGHEYTAANARFARTIERGNPALAARVAAVDAARAEGRPTVPSRLSEERATNPYLRADLPALADAVGLPGADPVDVFAEIRSRKDRF